MWNLCKQPECEAYTARPDGDYCESCRRLNAKLSENETKSLQKRAQLLSKPRQVRKRVSKNPKDWKNTFLCSDGTRVTQAQINENLRRHYLCSLFRIMVQKRTSNRSKKMKTEKKEKSVGFAIFSKILENKKAIEKSIKEGRSISKIKGVNIAKPI